MPQPNGRITLAIINSKLDSVIETLKQHDVLLRGTESTPGFLTRVDRLEQTEQSRLWHLKTLWVAILGLLSGLVGVFWK